MLTVRSFGHFHKPYEERPRRWDADLELEPTKDPLFHIQHLLTRVRMIRDVYAVTNLSGVYLLVLARDQERRYPHELQLASVHVLLHAESVDNVAREIKRRVRELELQVHLDDPVDEDGAHLAVYVDLRMHVHSRRVLLL